MEDSGHPNYRMLAHSHGYTTIDECYQELEREVALRQRAVALNEKKDARIAELEKIVSKLIESYEGVYLYHCDWDLRHQAMAIMTRGK